MLVDDMSAREAAERLAERFRDAYSSPVTDDERAMRAFEDEAARRLLSGDGG